MGLRIVGFIVFFYWFFYLCRGFGSILILERVGLDSIFFIWVLFF